MKRVIDIEFFSVKQDFMKALDGAEMPAVYGTTFHTDAMRDYRANPDRDDKWVGGSITETRHWMKNGYRAPEFKNAGRYVRDSKKNRRTFNDQDGNLDLDRLYAGEEKFFEKRTPKTAKPGMTINVEYCFAAMVNAKDVREYGAWVAGLCGSLEKQGFDLEVNVDTILNGLFRGEQRTDETTVRMKVKKRGQKSRFTSWSCLFAPTGWRHIVFHALHVAGAKIGKTPTSSLGMTLAKRGWGVDYDRKENVITIRCDQRTSIDLKKLNDDATAAGLI